MGILEVLTLIFVIAKLGGYVDWSWWQVFSPMYPAVVIYTALILFFYGAWRKVSK